MLQLKTLETDAGGFPADFARLVFPHGDFHSNEELYAAVRAAGHAVIQRYIGAFKMTVSPTSEWVSAADFETTWEGD